MLAAAPEEPNGVVRKRAMRRRFTVAATHRATETCLRRMIFQRESNASSLVRQALFDEAVLQSQPGRPAGPGLRQIESGYATIVRTVTRKGALYPARHESVM